MHSSTLPTDNKVLLNYFTAEQSNYLTAFDKSDASIKIDAMQQDHTLHLCGKNYNLHELFISLLKKTGPVNVKILSYSMTDFPMRIISQLHADKSIMQLSMVLDHTVSRTPALDQFVRQICPDMRYTDSHCKILLMENDNWHIALISSANFTRNNRWENYIIFSTQSDFDIYSKMYQTIYEQSNE